MSAPLMEAFGPQGMLAAALDGYQLRPAQLAMAEAVDAAIHDGRHLMVEAPRGTGHVLAWGVPAAWYAAMEEGQVLVVTASLAEQERLLTRDLPALAEALPWELTVARLEGSGTYLCRAKLAEVRQAAAADPQVAEVPFLRGLLAWAERTATGCLAELDERPPAEVWSALSTGAEACPGSPCPFFGSCFGQQATERARTAHLVVTRYPVLLALLRERMVAGESHPLHRLDVVVLEQAHRAADLARTALGWRLGLPELTRHAEHLRELDLGWLAEALEREAGVFCRDLVEVRRAARGQARLREPDSVPTRSLARRLEMAAEHLDRAGDAAEAAGDVCAAVVRRRRARACRVLVARLHEGIGLNDSDLAVSIEVDAWDRGVLVGRRMDLPELLPELLFEPARVVVLCSDTLTAGGSFGMVRHELGVPEPEELIVAPPAGAEAELPLVLPTELPEPGERAWPLAVARLVPEVARLVPGRVLVLLSSGSQLDLVRRGLRGSRRPVLCEGQAAPGSLLADFAREPAALLLGTPAFLEAAQAQAQLLDGLPIDALVLDRLPFAGAEDPVIDAVRERDPRWFGHLGLPRAVIALRRLVGLLGSPGSRRGALVLLDRRLVDKPYGRFFLRSLPPVRLVRRLEQLPHLLGAASAPPSNPGVHP